MEIRWDNPRWQENLGKEAAKTKAVVTLSQGLSMMWLGRCLEAREEICESTEGKERRCNLEHQDR